MKKLTITVGKDGNSTIDGEGFSGGVCESTIKEIILAVGGEETEDKKKPEYFDPNGDNFNELFTNR